MTRACLLVAAAAACAGCAARDEAPAVQVIDLSRELPRAEMRPADGLFQVVEDTRAGVRHAGIEVPAPSRVVWTLRFPVRAVLRAHVAVVPADGDNVTVAFRVGVSDDRLYEQLAEARVSSAARDPSWVPLSADLSAYAGRKWSLFYRPDSRSWRLVLSADRIDGRGRAVWAAAGVDADLEAARKWAQRQ